MDTWVDAPPSDIVFIGNVAYGTTEEELRKMLELAGPVVDIQLVFDPIANRAKGFGFCQYADRNIAASAIKNLNDALVDGRNIKIGYADRGRVRRYLGTDGTRLSGGNGGTLLTRTAAIESNAPAIPQLRSIAPGHVDALVGTLDERQRRELIGQFRSFASVNVHKAKEELARNPALAYALCVALESLNVVDESVLSHIRGAPSTARPPPAPGAPPLRQGYSPPGPGYSPSRQGYSPPPFHGVDSGPVISQPQQEAYEPQAMQNPAPPALEPDLTAEMDNTEILNQLLSLTDEQLAQLPEDHRNQILDLRRQIQGA
ncbi:hypothetical protein IWQ57_003492 [Coemansia nantahalensis]|uniref:Uncharacterized protein n=1 Tax=Coemansia nantahalensis TaxID=2789366 RepID=A0ACC1JW82_9FUNG|nr:hypothetical protein IWQ57_003492 [Coemansia nantahalensis]